MMITVLSLANCMLSVSSFSMPALGMSTKKTLLSSSKVPRRLFPSDHALEDAFEKETKGKWPRPLLLLDFDNCPMGIEERLPSLMLTCRAAAIPLRVVASKQQHLPNLDICHGLRLVKGDTKEQIGTHSLSVERKHGSIGQYFAVSGGRYRLQPKVMIVTTKEYDKDKLCHGGKLSPTDIDIFSSYTQLLSPFWKDALDIDSLSDLKQQAAMSKTVLSYLDHSNPVGALNEMQQKQDHALGLTFTELPYVARELQQWTNFEFCFECRISGKQKQLRSVGYGFSAKSAKQEAAYSILAQLALEARSRLDKLPAGASTYLSTLAR